MPDKINLNKVLERLASGDKRSLEELFNYYYPRLYNFSRAFLKWDDGIDDILQEVFIRIWENRKNIHTSATFNSFIFTITRNLLLNELRMRMNRGKMMEKYRELVVAGEYQFPEHVEFKELSERIDKLVSELPERQKEVYCLSRHHGFSHKEISNKLQIAEKTIEYHIHQSVSYIKKGLGDLGLTVLFLINLFF